MNGDFIRCCAFSLVQEGGFCNVKGDPGGATNHGITMATLSQALGRPATVLDVRNLTDAQAEAIYLPDYWSPVHGDQLPAGLDQVVFDFGVNAGPRTSIKRLQAVLGVDADGVIGPGTLAALAQYNVGSLIAVLSYSHTSYYQGLPGFGEFGEGWVARVQRCHVAAMAMLGS